MASVQVTPVARVRRAERTLRRTCTVERQLPDADRQRSMAPTSSFLAERNKLRRGLLDILLRRISPAISFLC